MSFFDPPSRRERLSRLPAFAQYEERMSAYASDGTDPYPSDPSHPSDLSRRSDPAAATDPWGMPSVETGPPWEDSTSWDAPPVPAQPDADRRTRVSGPFEAPPEDQAARPRRRTGFGALAGILSAAAALGIANLVAAFVRPQASPIIAVGDAFIDHTPPALKNFAVQYFGENDKNALLIGMYVTITLLAMVIGMLAWRHVSVGLIALALFGAFGAYVAVTRPESRITDVIPSAAGGLTGMAAISLLAWAGKPKNHYS